MDRHPHDRRRPGIGTAREYRSYLDGRLAGPLATRPLAAITRDDLDAWWQDNGDKPTARQHAYVFAKSVLKDATDRGLIGANPCQVVNAARRARVVPKQLRSELVTGLSVADVDQLVAAMDRESFRAMLLLVALCGLRPGGVFALPPTLNAAPTATGAAPPGPGN